MPIAYWTVPDFVTAFATTNKVAAVFDAGWPPTHDRVRPLGASNLEMLLRSESKRQLVAPLARQFQELRQNKPYLLDHGRPSVGLDHKPGNVAAGRDPDARFAVPTCVD